MPQATSLHVHPRNAQLGRLYTTWALPPRKVQGDLSWHAKTHLSMRLSPKRADVHRKPKVDDLATPTCSVNHDVVSFNVPVHDAVLMYGGQCLQQL